MKKFIYKSVAALAVLCSMAISNAVYGQKYCYPSFSSGCGSDSISYFQFGAYKRTTKCVSGSVDTSLTASNTFTIYRGKSYSLEVDANATNYFGIYIDYNKNGSFDDAGEFVANDGNGTYAVYTGNVQVPIDAPINVTRLRVLIASTGSAIVNYNNDCSGSYSGGELQDYKITVAAYTHDLAVMSLLSPLNQGCPSSAEKVQVLLRNIGATDESNFPVTMKAGSTTKTVTYTRTIKSNTTDTFTVGYFNASTNSAYSVKVYTGLTGDGDNTNDTLTSLLNIAQPVAPKVTGTVTHCGPGQVYLHGKSTTGSSSTYWFTSATAITPIDTGDSIQTPYLAIGNSATYYAESRFPNTNSLTKGSWSTIRANYGNMFDVFAKSNVTVDSLDVNFGGSNDSCFIYYKIGTYSGYQAIPSAWTPLCRVAVTDQGSGKKTRVKLPTPFNLVDGTTYGFYVLPYSGPEYYDITYSTSNPESNNELTITAGASTPSGYWPSCTGLVSGSRDWNGTFYYHYQECNSPRVSTTLTILQNPHGANIAAGTPFNGTFAKGTPTNPDQVCVGDTITYTLTPPTGMTNADFGTKWAVSALSFATVHGYNAKDTIVRLPTATKSGYLKFFPKSSVSDSVFILSATMVIPTNGCDSTMQRYVQVNVIPTSSFVATPTTGGCAGRYISATNNSTPAKTATYKWAFGNGDSTIGAVPIYKYVTSGTYTMTLITSNGPCSAKSTQKITVYNTPYGSSLSKGALFEGNYNNGDINNPDDVCVGDTITYTFNSPKGVSNSDYGTKWKVNAITFLSTGGNKTVDTLYKKPTSSKNASLMFFPDARITDSVYQIKIDLIDLPGNCDSVLQRYVHVRANPKAVFKYTNACLGNPLTFKDSSYLTQTSATVTGWSWNFGDGTNPNPYQYPSHNYAKSGVYNVTLTATTSYGCSASTTIAVQQFPLGVPKFGTQLACSGLQSTFTDSSTILTGKISTWAWSFGNGSNVTTSKSSSQTQTYTKSGYYNVRLVTTTNLGCNDTLTKRIRILPTPTPVFSDRVECVGTPISVSTAGSKDSVLGSKFSWNYGDGTATTSSASHTYAANGSYRILLTMTSGNGCTDTLSHSITPYSKPNPKITFAAACAGKPVSFMDSSGSGNTATYVWNFGDGGTQNNGTPAATYTYAKAGTYTVDLQITNANACVDSQQKTIVIAGFPVASFSANSVCAGNTTTFINTSTATGGSYSWNFGDSTANSNVANPIHKFAVAGSYSVALSATNKAGCTDTTIKSVTVNPLPIINPWSKKINHYTVSFIPADTSIGSFKWYFGTATNDSSSKKEPVFEYPAVPGKYLVKLVVTNASGCSTVDTTTLTINKSGIEIPSATFSGISVFPNPFEGTTSISYSLAARSNVSINIYDEQGKLVAKLKEGQYPAGSYNDVFDTKAYNTGAGVYYLKMYVNDKFFTTKMVNLK